MGALFLASRKVSCKNGAWNTSCEMVLRDGLEALGAGAVLVVEAGSAPSLWAFCLAH